MDAGFVIVLAALGVLLLVERDGFPWLNLFIGVMWLLNGGAQYLIYRRRRAAEASVETQVENRAEPGGPRSGG
jgi:hypothetical protein